MMHFEATRTTKFIQLAPEKQGIEYTGRVTNPYVLETLLAYELLQESDTY